MHNIKQAEFVVNESSTGNSRGILNESQGGLSGLSQLRSDAFRDSSNYSNIFFIKVKNSTFIVQFISTPVSAPGAYPTLCYTYSSTVYMTLSLVL